MSGKMNIEQVWRVIDPFDTMWTNRLLAPHDLKLNDIRWLIGESLRRTHQRARLDALRAVATERIGSTGYGLVRRNGGVGRLRGRREPEGRDGDGDAQSALDEPPV